MKLLEAIAVAVLFAVSPLSQAEVQPTPFAGGRAEVVLPENFSVVSTSADGLVATFGAKGDHKLEVSINDVGGSAAASDIGEQFVRAQAQKKRLRLSQGAGRVVVMEPGGEFVQDGVQMRSAHWQVGAGQSVFVVTLTAPAAASPELDAFLGRPLNVLVSSLRRRG